MRILIGSNMFQSWHLCFPSTLDQDDKLHADNETQGASKRLWYHLPPLWGKTVMIDGRKDKDDFIIHLPYEWLCMTHVIGLLWICESTASICFVQFLGESRRPEVFSACFHTILTSTSFRTPDTPRAETSIILYLFSARERGMHNCTFASTSNMSCNSYRTLRSKFELRVSRSVYSVESLAPTVQQRCQMNAIYCVTIYLRAFGAKEVSRFSCTELRIGCSSTNTWAVYNPIKLYNIINSTWLYNVLYMYIIS